MQDRSEPTRGRVSLVTLGCARNEVDSEELAARLAVAGWELTDDMAAADVAVINTCGFIEQAKKDSIDILLQAADVRADADTTTRAVVAVGCLAQRYGKELAEQLPEADAVLGFDSYPELAGHLRSVLAGRPPPAHQPQDRRRLLPVTPVARPSAAAGVSLPGHGTRAGAGPGTSRPASGPPVLRRRLGNEPWAPLKIASGCDRRCAFCAIPAFRGAMVSRPPEDVLAEAQWLAARGVREVLLVSENTTSYGKDLGDLHALEALLPRLAAVPGIDRVRVSYLQPAEIRPGTIEAIAATEGVAAYFDLSFQHAAPRVLRAMRRFGDPDAFLGLIERIRALHPQAGIRSNVIVGFPGETEAELGLLGDFLAAAELDVVGVFGYSDEEGTAAAQLPGKHDEDEIRARVAAASSLVEHVSDA
ncbi:MAG: 30S ribosomal protein S12 methylthiotransferase RimO, partial [Micrococcales bacterium]